MNKSVLISIRPQWCELIASGKKTIEVRKTCPKLETPFKCYIYCTLQGSPEAFALWDKDVAKWNREGWGDRKGKVIGEFICGHILDIPSRGVDHNFDYCYESLKAFGNDDIEPYITVIKKSCIGKAELNAYGKSAHHLYGWHIINLVIYDKPKELAEFGMKRAPQSWCYVSEARG